MEISVSEAHNRLSHWLSEIEREDITITRRGKAVGVLVSPTEYQRLGRLKAYLDMLRLAKSLEESGVAAHEIIDSSRGELESRQ
jgi:prevent-host-death family protein